jgi:hypothetical protein
MVVILVVLTFLVLIVIGAVMEFGTKKATENGAETVISANHVFAQDGGEKLESEDINDKTKEE